ncbi:hypothetical protein [Nocardia blacklockiae]|uniref:hypothetical protein n=1 Tax=Nocardia blacklockiae TaxID=480036 RepID=UPI0018945111|nr:hypothetical protein [Nocardia blacklockiae]MBF6174653.1 hypothetical protein [Nocardia blacklockiae]
MPDAGLLAELRRIVSCGHTDLDVAVQTLSDREIAFLSGQLAKVAVHLATRIGGAAGLPPPGTLPGAGAEQLDLSAQRSALPVARMFVRNSLFRWQWGDVLHDADGVTQVMCRSFVAAVEAYGLGYPTRMTLRLRVLSAARLIVELHDSAENAALVSTSDQLVTAEIEQRSVRCGRHRAGGRTVLWAELARPEFGRWQ